MLTRQAARKILNTYGRAWTKRDTSLILSIFEKDATYWEKWYGSPHKGQKGIAAYWNDTIVGKESQIKFKVLNYWIAGNTILAEWEARFKKNYPGVKRKNKHLRGMLILEMKGNKIKSLREIWQKKA
jgi:ketosteroid isomerase-like protein